MGEFLANLLWTVLGFFFPSLAPPSPEAKAQAEQDRADTATAALKAKEESDAIEDAVRDRAAADPGSLRDSDKFEIR